MRAVPALPAHKEHVAHWGQGLGSPLCLLQAELVLCQAVPVVRGCPVQ